jgi:hypothetical protein
VTLATLNPTAVAMTPGQNDDLPVRQFCVNSQPIIGGERNLTAQI